MTTPRHAPKLPRGQRYVVRYGASGPVGHITSVLRECFTVCGLQCKDFYSGRPLKPFAGPQWGTPTGDLGAGQRLCKSCDRMKDADTVRMPEG